MGALKLSVDSFFIVILQIKFADNSQSPFFEIAKTAACTAALKCCLAFICCLYCNSLFWVLIVRSCLRMACVFLSSFADKWRDFLNLFRIRYFKRSLSSNRWFYLLAGVRYNFFYSFERLHVPSCYCCRRSESAPEGSIFHYLSEHAAKQLLVWFSRNRHYRRLSSVVLLLPFVPNTAILFQCRHALF